MFVAMGVMTCPDLAVPAEVMQHVVQVESHANPYAIGVVGERLVRQPQNLDEALATVRMLEAGNYNYSLGLAQVNRANLQPYGLDSYRKAFMPCANLAAGAHILAECYTRSGRDWDKAFSCYYSGDFVTGYRDGYVRKIHDSIAGGATTRAVPGQAGTITGSAESRPVQPVRNASSPRAPGSPAYRVAIRSTVFDTAAPALSIAGNAGAGRSRSAAPAGVPGSAAARDASAAIDAIAASTRAIATVAASAPAPTAAFVPAVHGPGDSFDPGPTTAPTRHVSASGAKSGLVDHADLHKEAGDAAFVF